MSNVYYIQATVKDFNATAGLIEQEITRAVKNNSSRSRVVTDLAKCQLTDHVVVLIYSSIVRVYVLLSYESTNHILIHGRVLAKHWSRLCIPLNVQFFTLKQGLSGPRPKETFITQPHLRVEQIKLKIILDLKSSISVR